MVAPNSFRILKPLWFIFWFMNGDLGQKKKKKTSPQIILFIIRKLFYSYIYVYFSFSGELKTIKQYYFTLF